jgi:hypothetical protein
MPLLIGVAPCEHESFVGYLLRMTEENHYSSVATILRLAGCGVHSPRVVDLARLSRRLAELNGVPPEVVEQSAYAQIDKAKVSFGPTVVSRGSLDLQRPKYCPLCLARSPFRLKVWDLFGFQACPTHQIWLVSGCRFCGPNLRWRETLNTRCVCGRELTAVPTDNCGIEVAALMSVIASAANDARNQRLARLFPRWITSLELDDLLGLICGLGTFQVSGRYSPSDWSRDHISAREVVRAAAHLLTRWPAAFHTLLDKRIEYRQKTPGSQDFLHAYGSTLWREMKLRETCTRAAVVAAELQQHALVRFNSAPATAFRRLGKTLTKAGVRPHWLTADAFQKALGIDRQQLNALCRAASLDPITERRGKLKYRWFRASDLSIARKILQEIQNHCSRRKAAEILQVSIAEVRSLISAGKLTTKKFAGRRFEMISLRDVAAVMRRRRRGLVRS